MARKYSEKMYQRLWTLRSKIVDPCSICNGTGFVGTDSISSMCDCSKIFRYIRDLVYSEVPSEYWSLHLDDLCVDSVYKKLVSFYTSHLSNAMEKSLGIMFMGTNGVGKTSLLCEIAKHAIVRGIDVLYITAQQYIDAIQHSRDEVIHRVDQARMVLLDEVDKAYMKEGSSYVPQRLESFFRHFISDGRVFSIAGNSAEDDLIEMLGESTISMLKRHLQFVDVEGEDYSKTVQDKWKSSLVEECDYSSRAIVEFANQKFKIDNSASPQY